jgi:hypothetical protein
MGLWIRQGDREYTTAGRQGQTLWFGINGAILTPTWSHWPAVIAAQNEDVDSPGPWYRGRWNTDDGTWNLFELTGLAWDAEGPEYFDTIYLEMNPILNRLETNQTDLWNPVGTESTQWTQVSYPK